jgi:serine/threonine protein kinase
MYHLLANMAPTPAFLPSEPLPLANYNGALSYQTVSIIEKAMERDRKDRFQSAMEMRRALVDALPMPYTPPVVVTTPRPVPQPVRPAAVPAAVPRTQPQPVAAPKPTPKPVSTKTCPSCGRSNKKSAGFCVGCGRAFGPARPAILRVIEPVRAAWEMPVARSPMLLGRSSEAEGFEPDFDMTFYDDGDYVSRRHARISKGRGGYFIADLGSSNGTTVNGFSLEPKRAYHLRNGDHIKVGLVVIQFRIK